MKKLIAIILSAVMLLTLVPAAVIAAPTADEVGKVATGYTPAGKGIASLAEATDPAGSYYLTADITVETTIPAFSGTLDGNGHTVTVSAPLFGELSGTVKNLTIAGTVPAPAASEHTGALAKTSSAALTVENVKNTAAVSGVLVDLSTDLFATAGFIGKVTGNLTVTNCANTGDVHGQAAGGFVGYINGEITVAFKNCLNTGKVYTTDCGTVNKFVETIGEKTYNVYFGIGGIAGTTNGKSNVTFEDCKNSGAIDATALQIPSGGILGASHVIDNTEEAAGRSVTFKNCENTASIAGSWQTGGIGGWIKASSYTEGCKNSGKITSTKSYCGGIFGRINPDNAPLVHTIKSCANSGEVVSATGQAGGILGYASLLKLTVDGCTNSAKITTVKGHVGGIIGSFKTLQECSVTNCTNTGEIVGAEAQTGSLGGIVGTSTGDNTNHVNKITIKGCKNTANVTGNHNASTWAGGIVGYIADGVFDIENVVNEGKIYTKHYGAGIVGRFGANDTAGTITIKNATNAGEVGSGIGDSAGILGYSAGHVVILTSVNTGYIFNETNRAAGIYGSAYNKATNSILIDKCINFGDIKADDRVGGIAVALGNTTQKDAYVISNCVNYGNLTVDVTSGNHYIGGIAGYAYGGSGTNGILNSQNYGNITVTAPEGEYTGEIITAGIVGYYNTTTYNLRNCLNAGKIDVKASGEKVITFHLFYNKNADGCSADYVKDNLYYGNDGLAVQQNGTQEVNGKAITADVLASGKIAYDFNKAAGETILYQTIGTDAVPTAKNTSKVVLLVNGAYTNTAPVAPSPAPTGDSAFAIVLALVAVSCGAVLTMKKAR